MTSTCWHDDSQDGSSEWIFLKYFLNTKTTQGMKLQFLAEANCCYIPNELAGGDYRSAQRPHFSGIICLNTVWQIWTTLKETGHTYKEGECVFNYCQIQSVRLTHPGHLIPASILEQSVYKLQGWTLHLGSDVSPASNLSANLMTC